VAHAECVRDTMTTTLSRFFEGTMVFLPDCWLPWSSRNWLARAWLLKLFIRRALVVARFDHFCGERRHPAPHRADIVDAPSTSRPRGLLARLRCLSHGGGEPLGWTSSTPRRRVFSTSRVFAALVILLLGFLIGNFLSRAVLLAAVNANLPRLA